MSATKPTRARHALRLALACSLGTALTACASGPEINQTLYSTKQPVVERSNFTLDLATGAGGLTMAEQARLSAWFETLDLDYGDRVYIDDPLASSVTRDAIASLAERRGIMISEGAPVTPGYVDPGTTRVVVTRSRAYVPGCPDWSKNSATNYANATSPGFGCAVNGNLAAMVADPEDLLKGDEGTGETVVMTSNKAIGSYREQAPTGEGGLTAGSTGGGGSQ